VFVRDRQTGKTEPVSITAGGAPGNGWSRTPAISADGRFIAFASGASDLVPGDTNGGGDIFVRDRQTGKTELVSVGSGGEPANQPYVYGAGPAISADGRFVAFMSDATNLVAGNSAGGLFIRDHQNGKTQRVGDGNDPAISGDGRFIAFWSWDYDRVPGGTNAVASIFVWDRQAGQAERVSVPVTGTVAGGNSVSPAISADGRFVAFTSDADNLVAGDTNQRSDVFIAERG
jgi:Tol biopolymer transport system component